MLGYLHEALQEQLRRDTYADDFDLGNRLAPFEIIRALWRSLPQRREEETVSVAISPTSRAEVKSAKSLGFFEFYSYSKTDGKTDP